MKNTLTYYKLPQFNICIMIKSKYENICFLYIIGMSISLKRIDWFESIYRQ